MIGSVKVEVTMFLSDMDALDPKTVTVPISNLTMQDLTQILGLKCHIKTFQM